MQNRLSQIDNGLVSVIIPTYNRESLIIKSIKSVLNQTYNNLEVIVVDDCSTDNTVELVKGINDPRLKLLKNSMNCGACYSRNRGIEAAKGVYIAFHDSDDYWRPQKLEREMFKIQESGADVVICKYLQHKKTEEKIVPKDVENGFCTLQMALRKFIFATPCILGKRKVFEAIRFDENLPRLQDFELGIRLCESYKVYIIDEILMDAYIQNDSITQDVDKLCIALESIINKHRNLLLSDTEAMEINLNRLIGKKAMNRKNCVDETKELMLINPTLKNTVKYMLSRVGLIGTFYKLYRN